MTFITEDKADTLKHALNHLGALADIKYCICKGDCTQDVNLPSSQGEESQLEITRKQSS